MINKRVISILIITMLLFCIGCSSASVETNNVISRGISDNESGSTTSSASIDDKKESISTDVSFISMKFPELGEVKSARYYYIVTSDTRSIGLQSVEFCGLVWIGNNFANEIANNYDDWSECNVKPPEILADGLAYSFVHSEDFDDIFSSSFVGEFYFDRDKGVLYFDGEY
jgi:hypothetical protein